MYKRETIYPNRKRLQLLNCLLYINKQFIISNSNLNN